MAKKRYETKRDLVGVHMGSSDRRCRLLIHISSTDTNTLQVTLAMKLGSISYKVGEYIIKLVF